MRVGYCSHGRMVRGCVCTCVWTSLALVLALFTKSAAADEAIERYHVPYADIAASVLQDVIGIVTVTGRGNLTTPRHDEGYQTYVIGDQRFDASTWVLENETMPMSTNRYFDVSDVESVPKRNGVETSRYPATGVREGHLQIVIDSRLDRRVWVRQQELEVSFGVRVDMLEDLVETCRTQLDIYANIAHFTGSGRRRVYEEPRRDAESFVMNCRARRRFYGPSNGENLFKVLDRQGEYIKIAWHDPNMPPDGVSETVGWMRLRSNTGELLRWIEAVDTC